VEKMYEVVGSMMRGFVFFGTSLIVAKFVLVAGNLCGSGSVWSGNSQMVWKTKRIGNVGKEKCFYTWILWAARILYYYEYLLT
jgi:hypothetical protein